MEFEGLFEAAPDAILLVDTSGILRKVNKQTEALFGYSRAELIGQPIEMLVPKRYRGKHIDLRSRYLNDPTLRPMGAGRNLTGERKDGTEIPVDIMLSPGTKAQAGMVIAVVRDIHERRTIEQGLETSEAMFRALFDQAPDAILAVDKKGVIARTNRQVESMLGYTETELVGKSVEMLVPERFRGHHTAYREGYAKNPVTRTMGSGRDLCAQRKDGSEVPVDILLSPVQLPGTNLVISVLRDVTERRLAEKALQEHSTQLKRSNEELEQFAYVASHDLQEPLRAVAASCQVLEKRLSGKLDEDTGEYLNFAVDGAKRMQELIHALLSYSRVGRGKEFGKVELAQVFERVLGNLRTQITDTHAVVQAQSLPTVKGDFSQLVQLLQNLISNAMKFHGGEFPRVEVSAQAGDKGFWTIGVKDNGIGIPAEYQHKIFVLFQRLHKREDYPGTGIGLAVCKKIVERHGGHIWVDSASGKGSTFSFTIPTF